MPARRAGRPRRCAQIPSTPIRCRARRARNDSMIDDLLARADKAVGYGDGDAAWGDPAASPPKAHLEASLGRCAGSARLLILLVLDRRLAGDHRAAVEIAAAADAAVVTLLAADGTPIARRGAIIGTPVDAAKLPDSCPQRLRRDRGSALLFTLGDRSARHPARRLPQSGRRRGARGRQHDHAAARQERVPRCRSHRRRASCARC